MANKRVTGVGGIFIRSTDPKKMKAWYEKHLGMPMDQYGAMFEFRQVNQDAPGYLQWSLFDRASTYMDPSKKDFMVNYRVADLEGLVALLREEGVTILDEIETYEYGKFVHIMDPEGNKIELWEPVDRVFEEGGYTRNSIHD